METTITFLTFAVSVIVLIVFFVMAARLKKIEENTNQASYGYKVRQFYEARSLELVGEKKEALKNYYQLLWRYTANLGHAGITKQGLTEKIKELGGNPDAKPDDFS